MIDILKVHLNIYGQISVINKVIYNSQKKPWIKVLFAFQ